MIGEMRTVSPATFLVDKLLPMFLDCSDGGVVCRKKRLFAGRSGCLQEEAVVYKKMALFNIYLIEMNCLKKAFNFKNHNNLFITLLTKGQGSSP